MRFFLSTVLATAYITLSAQVAPPPSDFVCEELTFQESFDDGIPAGWEVDAGLSYMGPLREYTNVNLTGWFIESGMTFTGGTGPDAAYDGEYYVYCEGGGGIGIGEIVTLTSPPIDLSFNSAIGLRFHLNMHGPSATMAVNVIQDGEVTNILPPVAGNIHASDEWEEIFIDISDFRSTTIQIQFEAVKPAPVGGIRGDIAVDAISICGSFKKVPTLSEWAVIMLFLTLLIIGTVAVKQETVLSTISQ